MPNLAPGESQTIAPSPDQAVVVTTTGLAYVDLVAGAPGSPFESRRCEAGVPRRIGPFGETFAQCFADRAY